MNVVEIEKKLRKMNNAERLTVIELAAKLMKTDFPEINERSRQTSTVSGNYAPRIPARKGIDCFERFGRRGFFLMFRGEIWRLNLNPTVGAEMRKNSPGPDYQRR